MAKKKGSKSKAVEVDLSEFITGESVIKNEEEMITIATVPHEEKINYEEYFGTTPPFFLFFIDYSKQMTEDMLKRLLADIQYEKFEQEKSMASCFRVQFDDLKQVKAAHRLDRSVVNGKPLYVSFVSADKLDELKNEQRYNARGEKQGFSGSLNFRAATSDADAMENQFSLTNFRNSMPNAAPEPLSISGLRSGPSQSTSFAFQNENQTNISSFRSAPSNPITDAQNQSPYGQYQTPNVNFRATSANNPTQYTNQTDNLLSKLRNGQQNSENNKQQAYTPNSYSRNQPDMQQMRSGPYKPQTQTGQYSLKGFRGN